MKTVEIEVLKKHLIRHFLFVSILSFFLIYCSPASAKPLISKGPPSCKTLRVMARIYMAHGQYTKAQPLAEQALELAQKRNVSNQELSLCLLDLAYVYNNQGKFDEAEKMCKLGLALQEKIYYQTHPYIAYTLRTLSSIYQGQHRYEDAHQALDRAMSIMLENFPADDPVFAPLQVDFAKLLVAEGKLEQAEDYYNKALETINQIYGPDHLYTATVVGSLAELYVLQARYEQAESLINKALAVQERVYGPDHHLVAPAWITRAEICRSKGDYTGAENLIKKALAVVKKTGNTEEIARLQQRIEKVRAIKPDFGPVAGL
jgi:tetratricopeptide (TPR) repeat protein